MTYGNSITLTNTHNTAYQLTNRNIGSLMNENFTYDDANNITAKGSDSYTLDDLYRITAENSDSYTYDAIGNRLTKNTDDYTYPSTSSKLSDVEGDGVTYDGAGNITDDTARDYTIDAANRLASIEISSSTVGEYVYNASNQRTEKTVSSVTTHYVYGQGGLLYGEYDASGNMIREYVYLNGEPLAQIDDVASSDVVTYLHTDHLGSPRYGTNSGGTQVWAWDSDAFGIGTPTGSVTVNLRFPGQYFDDESDLHYNWNRYYNPETGRYISSDPIGLDGGLNTYLYANASPVMLIDPRGLTIWHGKMESTWALGGAMFVFSLRLKNLCTHGEKQVKAKVVGYGYEKGSLSIASAPRYALGTVLEILQQAVYRKSFNVVFDDGNAKDFMNPNPITFTGQWSYLNQKMVFRANGSPSSDGKYGFPGAVSLTPIPLGNKALNGFSLLE